MTEPKPAYDSSVDRAVHTDDDIAAMVARLEAGEELEKQVSYIMPFLHQVKPHMAALIQRALDNAKAARSEANDT